MTRRRGKVTISSTVSRTADDYIEKMVESDVFSNRSNVVESSVLLMYFVLNSNSVLAKAKELGIEPISVM